MFNLPKNVKHIAGTLKNAGFKAYLVGGCVRDMLIGTDAHDWDIATSARPEEVTGLFERVIPTGIDFGTVSVLLDYVTYEVTTFRMDGRYIDGRRPEKVSYAKTIEEDLSRRDFTINAIAYDPSDGKVIDPFHGKKDITSRIIRTVGDPSERFREDGLRALRACRFAGQLGFDIEEKTLEAVQKTLDIFDKVSAERVHDEIAKLMSSENVVRGIEYMRHTGLLKKIIPELEDGIGIEQPKPYHVYDVYFHNINTCGHIPKAYPLVRLAGLLHDISKPACRVEDTFYDHDNIGAETAEKILKRLKFSSKDIAKVSILIRNHMFNYTSEWTDAAVRRFIKRAGKENIDELFMLRIADMQAMERAGDNDYLPELKGRIEKVFAEENALHTNDLNISGQDIMGLLGIGPGPKVGQILAALLEKVLDDPSLNAKEKLKSLTVEMK